MGEAGGGLTITFTFLLRHDNFMLRRDNIYALNTLKHTSPFISLYWSVILIIPTGVRGGKI